MSDVVHGTAAPPAYPERCFWNFECEEPAIYYETAATLRRGCCAKHRVLWSEVLSHIPATPERALELWRRKHIG